MMTIEQPSSSDLSCETLFSSKSKSIRRKSQKKLARNPKNLRRKYNKIMNTGEIYRATLIFRFVLRDTALLFFRLTLFSLKIQAINKFVPRPIGTSFTIIRPCLRGTDKFLWSQRNNNPRAHTKYILSRQRRVRTMRF